MLKSRSSLILSFSSNSSPERSSLLYTLFHTPQPKPLLISVRSSSMSSFLSVNTSAPKGCSDFSTLSKPQRAISAPLSSMLRISLSYIWGSSPSSESMKATYSPFAALSPRFLAEEGPPFSFLRAVTFVCCSESLPQSSAVPSVEPSSTMMSSIGS